MKELQQNFHEGFPSKNSDDCFTAPKGYCTGGKEFRSDLYTFNMPETDEDDGLSDLGENRQDSYHGSQENVNPSAPPCAAMEDPHYVYANHMGTSRTSYQYTKPQADHDSDGSCSDNTQDDDYYSRETYSRETSNHRVSETRSQHHLREATRSQTGGNRRNSQSYSQYFAGGPNHMSYTDSIIKTLNDEDLQ